MLLKLVNMQNYSHVYSAHLFQTESSLRQHRCILSAHARESFRAIASGGL